MTEAMSHPQKRISRRDLVGRTGAAGLVAGLLSREAGAHAPNGNVPSTGYIDDHVHLTQPWYGPDYGPITASLLLDWMDAHDIAQAFVLPLVSPEAFWFPITTDFVLQETRPHRDRLLPFCDIDPRRLGTHLTSQKLVVDMLKRYVDAGAIGFGEHKCRVPIDDVLNMKLYEACVEVQLPVLFHLDNMSMMDKPGLPGLENVLNTFPELVMIGHAKGWWASISGNLEQADLHAATPQTPVAPGGAIDALMDKYPNLYGDLSSGGAAAMFRDPEFGREFLVRRAERLLWGTDYYDLHQTDFQQFDLFTRFQLPERVVAKISRENAERLFGLG